jgi:hypothetical protein
VAFLVDVAEETISDYKVGFCASNPFRNRETCCTNKLPLFSTLEAVDEDCSDWEMWSETFWGGFGIYVGFAILFGIVAGSVTMTTKSDLPAASQDDGKPLWVVMKDILLANQCIWPLVVEYQKSRRFCLGSHLVGVSSLGVFLLFFHYVILMYTQLKLSARRWL